MTRILLTNDDGYSAAGINFLFETLSQKYEVIMVAPERERSTCGHGMTLHKPLRLKKFDSNRYWVSGTPVDCTVLGLREVCKDRPVDYVVSGINHGANLGQDVFYSGTMAGAREGAFHGIPSFALSLDVKYPVNDTELLESYLKNAAEYFFDFFQESAPKLAQHFHKSPKLFNMNFPFVPRSQYQSLKVCTLGRKQYSSDVKVSQDLRDKSYYWIGGKYTHAHDIANSDCVLIGENHVTLSPLTLDHTHQQKLHEVAKVLT